MSERAVGPLGESTLRKLASEANASLTRTDDDRWGWDYLLEFPLPLQMRSEEADRVEELCRCLVQVKSTDSPGSSCQVKVSNWMYLVGTALPSFILALHFDGTRDCSALYVVHIWDDQISTVLRRVRELGVAGEGDQLHKHKLTVRWRDTDRLPEVSGKALLRRIEEHIGPSPAAYSDKKLQLWRSVGYDAGNALVTVRIEVPPEYQKRHPDELLADSVLGLVPSLQVAGGEVRDLRFGIPGTLLRPISAGARLTLGPARPAAIGTLQLRTADRLRTEQFPVQVLVPSGMQYKLASAAQKVLFRLPYADLVVPLYGTKADIHFDLPATDALVSLSEIACVARLFRFLAEIAREDAGPVEIWLDERQVGTIDAQREAIPRELLDWSDLVLLASRVAAQLQLPETAQTTVAGIVAQRNALMMIDAATGDARRHSITFTFALHAGAAPVPGEEMGFPVHLEVELGGKRAVIFETLLGFPGEELLPTGEYVVPVQRAVIDQIVSLRPGEALPKKREEYLDGIAEKYSRVGGVLCWWRKAPEAATR